jgi:4-hydroxymandelate oxidase
MLPLLAEYEREASQALPPAVWGNVAASAGDGISAAEAESAWRAIRLYPRVFRDVSVVETSTTVLGTAVTTPILPAPTGYHVLVDTEGEVATARGLAAAGSLPVVSGRSTRSFSDVAAVAGPWWMQVYVMRDRGLTSALVERAVRAGARALVLTADTPYLGGQPSGDDSPITRDMHLTNLRDLVPAGSDAERALRPDATAQDPSLTFDVIGWLRDLSGLPVIVKGVLRADDARACLAAGASGLVVSNHGGRQLDRAVSTAAALPAIVDAVGSDAEIYVDGGLRDGVSVLAALALGARAVMIGRPVIWGLAAAGSAGVTAVVAALTRDLAASMALAGARTITDIGPDLRTPPP